MCPKKRLLIPALRHSTNGWTSVKLYFMMGLPTETMEDVEGIADLGMQVVHAFYKTPIDKRNRASGFNQLCLLYSEAVYSVPMGTGGYNGKLESKSKHIFLSMFQAKKLRFLITKPQPL